MTPVLFADNCRNSGIASSSASQHVHASLPFFSALNLTSFEAQSESEGMRTRQRAKQQEVEQRDLLETELILRLRAAAICAQARWRGRLVRQDPVVVRVLQAARRWLSGAATSLARASQHLARGWLARRRVAARSQAVIVVQGVFRRAVRYFRRLGPSQRLWLRGRWRNLRTGTLLGSRLP